MLTIRLLEKFSKLGKMIGVLLKFSNKLINSISVVYSENVLSFSDVFRNTLENNSL